GPRLARLLFAELGLALDVDAQAHQAVRQAGVLAFLADRQGQLVVGHDHLGRAGGVVDAHLGDLRRGEGLHHELRQVLGEGDDVDLLAVELVDDHAHAATAGTDARTDRVDVRVVRVHGDLRALPGFAGAGLDLDDAVGDLGNLELEQALDETGVRA